MIDIKDRVCEAVAGKIMSAEAAAEFVKDGDNVGTSGFTPSGYPKAVPLALAEKGKKTPFQIALMSAGRSTAVHTDRGGKAVLHETRFLQRFRDRAHKYGRRPLHWQAGGKRGSPFCFLPAHGFHA